MKPKGARTVTVPVGIGGEYTAGDPSAQPDGTVRLLRNYLVRPGRFDQRPPFVYDSLDGAVTGFGTWSDLVNEVTKTVALRTTDSKLYTKNTNGSGWDAGVSSGVSSGRVTASANMLGKLYLMIDNGSGVPTTAAAWDGTTFSTTPFNTTIVSRSVAAFIDRLFLFNPRVTVTNMVAGAVLFGPYDWSKTSPIAWGTLTNVTAALLTQGSTKTCRVTPTSTTSAVATFGPGGYTNAFNGGTPFVYRQDLRNCSSTYAMPFTMEIFIQTPWVANTAYALNAIVSDGTNRQRVTVAGTSQNPGPPTWNATVGATTTDGGVTWINEGSATFASFPGTLPTDGNWHTYWASGSLPAASNQLSILWRFKFGNTATPTITLSPIDVGYQDGLADGVVSKQNYGMQVTQGDFYFPFYNVEATSASTQNIDAVIWSEINNPKSILAANTYPLTEIAGIATAGLVTNSRLVAFKRRGMWVFRGVADPYEPILPEIPAISVGCLGPRAVAVSRDNTLYWIGEQHVYKMVIGSDTIPTEIDTPGMYESIMARGANWVESQSTYNQPLLAIDHKNKDVWVYTQKGVIYVYHIDTKEWSELATNPSGTSYEVAAIHFDEVGQRMIVSFGGAAVCRADETSDAKDTIANGGATQISIECDLQPKPFELFAPRYEATLDEVGIFHLATVLDAAGSVSLSYSLDRGSTWTTPTGYPITSFSLTNARIPLLMAATAPTVTVKVSRTGAGGARNFSISKADAVMRVHRGEIPWNQPH